MRACHINFVLRCALLLGSGSAYAAGISYTGVSGGDFAADSNWSGGTYPGSADYALLDTTEVLSSSTPNNIYGIRI